MNTRLILRYVVREALGLVITGAALFWSAGRLDWWPGWALLAVMLGWTSGTGFVIAHYHPALLAERLGPRRGSKGWDMALVSGLGITQLARYVLGGLDERFGWSGDFALGAQLAALVVCVLGYAWFLWATAVNAYFSQVVRIQSERGHTVVSNGPYCWVRHPGYLGAALYELASPIVLASWWSLIAGAAGALLLIVRTALEDRALRAELPGYEAYAGHVRYRLLPGVW